MNEETERIQHRSHLKPFVELAKYITDSPVCKINITGFFSHWAVSCNGDGVKSIPPEENIFNDPILQSGVLEIEDLKNNLQYQDRPYVKGDPYFRYYCGVQLITSKGTNIGSICVLDTESKRISENQKKQFQQLAELVVTKIESENRITSISAKLDTMHDSLQKLNHDVRNPIYGIVGIADMMIRDKDRIDEAQNKYIVMIKESAETMTNIIDGVLMAVNTEKNRAKLLEKKLLSSVPEKIKRLYSPLVKNKNLTLSLTCEIDSGIMAPHYFSIMLLQIIGNLVSNAVKFTPVDGSVEVIFASRSVENQNVLEIIVQDNGIGMTSEQVSAFNSGKPIEKLKGTNGEKGFGIGLQHIIQIVSIAGGTISVNASQTKGTRFSVSMPIPDDNSDILELQQSLYTIHQDN